MNEIVIKGKGNLGINDAQIREALLNSIEGRRNSLIKILIIPPDFTRAHSGAGKITAMYYGLLKDTCQIDILPALGTHVSMSQSEIREFFGEEIPLESFIVHDWRNDVVKIGEIPKDYVNEVSDGLVNNSIDVEVNKRLLDKSYDLIISVGQVVPHEVVGMANYTKNILVGCGGSNMINQSHMLGAFYGMERIMGRDHSPVRKVFDYAEINYLQDIPIMYALTVTTHENDEVLIHGLFLGRNRKLFEEAVALSQEKNLNYIDTPFKKVVVYLDKKEFKSTWLGNKAIYRTRMAIADGGELIVLAPGVERFGEDDENDYLIRRYGYVGRERVLELCAKNQDLKENLSAAAHLIHGSSDGRFSITYAVNHLSKDEIQNANFNYMPYKEACKIYDPEKLKDGYNTLENGEELYYISNPALGLWGDKSKF